MDGTERKVWDRHWQALGKESALFGSLASLVRRLVLRRAVEHYAEKYFPADGVFVDAGCGTGQASASIPARGRRLLGFDFSLSALAEARKEGPYRLMVGGDIRALPFRDSSLSGLWNLGVMEHFPREDGVAILREFRRVLAPGRMAVLFWPPEFGSSRWVLAPIEWAKTRLRGRPFHFFPDEVNRLRSRRHAREMLEAAGLEPVALDFTLWDCLIHLIVVARKPAS
ncbi:MAG TPA: methyltransferase domain-containing protein [Thermoanaerobaculia bacterium]|nr:methyltransferase domain-containing protein [Thermoanaerobaculia bacterium]